VASTPWLIQGIVALGPATALWLVVLLPAQLRMERADAGDKVVLERAFRRWSVVGWAATALLYYELWAMAGRVGA
jgi:hypothetical protein